MRTAELRKLIDGYRTGRAVQVAASLGLADVLAKGPLSAPALAKRIDCHGPSLLRLLRALTAAGLLREEEGAFALTETGETLRSDDPQSMRALAMLFGRPYYLQAWDALEHSIRTGENAFRHVHGAGAWDYRRERPEESALFDRAMQAATGVNDRVILEACDFSRFRTIVDVGGGSGALLAAILGGHPQLQGVLFDQPHVASGELLAAAGVLERCRVEQGSFFEAVPKGGDAYLLKLVLHDWEDDEARIILERCHEAMDAGATLLVFEQMLGSLQSCLSDLNMLVVPGGRERTAEGYAELLESAGFRFIGSQGTDGELSVIEAAVA